MKVLLDTQILVWSLMENFNLPKQAEKIIVDPENEIYYSIVSLWEIEIKHVSKPKLMPYSAEVVQKVSNEEAGFKLLPLMQNSIQKLADLKRPETAPKHKDPFDRILICQAVAEGMLFLTHDSLLPDYNASNIMFV